MPARIDLTGQRFGRLIAQSVDIEKGLEKNKKCLYWHCICDCGGFKSVTTNQLTSGKTNSCGCLEQENLKKISKSRLTHSSTGTRLHRIWKGMNTRCNNPNTPQYHNYGGRGIQICERWQGKNGFINFVEDMGNPPTEQHTIERIDVNGNYEPSNTKWATLKEQSRNKTNNVVITYKGITLTLTEWAENLGFSYDILHNRLEKGWNVNDAFSIPILAPGQKRNPFYRSRYIEFNGERRRIQEWADFLKIDRKTITERIRNGLAPLPELTTEKLPMYKNGEKLEY